MARPGWYESTLALHLLTTSQTWEALQAAGVDGSGELPLEFFYDAPGERAANALVAYLRAETDYEVVTGSQKKRLLAMREWNVAGSTQPMAVSLDILLEWVTRMVAAGAGHGPCKFNGWGAYAPEP